MQIAQQATKHEKKKKIELAPTVSGLQLPSPISYYF